MKRHSTSRRVSVIVGVVMGIALVAGVVLGAGSLVAEAQGGGIVLSKGQLADGARLTAAADFFLTGGSSRSRRAEAARLTALADYQFREKGDGCKVDFLTRGQQGEAFRLTRLGERHTGLKAYRLPVFNRGRIADGMRLSGLAAKPARDFDLASAGLACLVAR